MKLSLKVEYACRVLIQLASHHGNGRLLHIETLAEAEAVPVNYLVQILNELRNGGLIVSRRGKQGGYMLARAPEEVTLLDIVRVVDADLFEYALSDQGQSGPRVVRVWREVGEAMRESLARHTLQAMLTGGPSAMYYI